MDAFQFEVSGPYIMYENAQREVLAALCAQLAEHACRLLELATPGHANASLCSTQPVMVLCKPHTKRLQLIKG